MNASDWQPIEAFPKDSEDDFPLGCFGEHAYGTQFVAHYDERNPAEGVPYVWQTADGPGYHRDLPTHWQRLPPPPGK